MRILLVSSAFWPYPSGISEHVYYLAKGLIKRGHQVKILTTNYPSKWETGVHEDLDVTRFGRAVLIPLNKSAATFPFGFDIPYRTKQFLKQQTFDVIHMHGCYPPEIGFWALKYSKTVNCVTFHTVGFKNIPMTKMLSKIFKKYADKINGKIAVTKIAQVWAEPFFPGKYRVIPNGVDCERFSLNVQPIIKKEGNIFRILYLGRLDERKGVLIAINAFKKIHDKIPNTKLYIVGGGTLEKEACQLACNLLVQDSCQFLGYVKREDLPGYYASADAYVAPALGGEAQGIVLLEAMASGRPVIASDIEGYRAVIEDNKTGLFFKAGDAEDLAEKLQQVIQNIQMRKAMMKNARLSAERYSWDKIVVEIEGYYQELIERT
jgi:phosphatidyl-myo-inositol alpha-mannosyltransferase